jgi:quaternary ammonium compound-resistance protein SugE
VTLETPRGRQAVAAILPDNRAACCRRAVSRMRKEPVVAWVAIAVAGLLEVVWALAMKQSQGFTRLGPSLVTAASVLASFGLLAWSMRSLPLGVAYMAWTGIGATGAFIVGVAVLGEPVGPLRLLAAALIVSGLVLMRLSGSGAG